MKETSHQVLFRGSLKSLLLAPLQPTTARSFRIKLMIKSGYPTGIHQPMSVNKNSEAFIKKLPFSEPSPTEVNRFALIATDSHGHIQNPQGESPLWPEELNFSSTSPNCYPG